MIRSPSQCPGSAGSRPRPAAASMGSIASTNLRSASVGLLAGFAGGAAAAQLLGELAFELAAGVDVDRLVDRLGAHAHLRCIGEVLREPVADLLRRPLLAQSALHELPQVGVRAQRLRGSAPQRDTQDSSRRGFTLRASRCGCRPL